MSSPAGSAARVPDASGGVSDTRIGFYIPSLDGLRAVSILIVFLSHAKLTPLPGGFGVTVFFFLSGYLITTLLRREFAATGTIGLRDFYWRRAWRIFPPMYAALAFGVAASLLDFTLGEVTTEAVGLQALHLTNYVQLTRFAGEIPIGTGIMWSLAIEEHFYLIFPVCLLFLMRRRSGQKQAQVLLLACLAVLAWRFALVTVFDASIDRTYLATDTRIDAILFGCILGVYFNPMLDECPRPQPSIAVAGTGAAVLCIGLSMLYREDVYRETLRYTVQSAALAPIFYFAIQRPSLWIFSVLNIGWVRFIGVLSYSFYLIHHVVIFSFVRHLPDTSVWVRGLLSAIVSFTIAYAFYRFIEQPSAALRKRLPPPGRSIRT